MSFDARVKNRYSILVLLSYTSSFARISMLPMILAHRLNSLTRYRIYSSGFLARTLMKAATLIALFLKMINKEVVNSPLRKTQTAEIGLFMTNLNLEDMSRKLRPKRETVYLAYSTDHKIRCMLGSWLVSKQLLQKSSAHKCDINYVRTAITLLWRWSFIQMRMGNTLEDRDFEIQLLPSRRQWLYTREKLQVKSHNLQKITNT